MTQKNFADEFEAARPHLHAVAYRMLGSQGEAEDAVQEAWIRFNRTDTASVDNLRGWLTVVGRVCLDMLRSRKTRREDPYETELGDSIPDDAPAPDHEMIVADSVGLAMSVVLETLSPAERVAFVLHDMFDLSFDDVASILDRSPEATRQLASRARRRIQGRQASGEPDRLRNLRLVQAFHAASRDGDFEGLMAVLAPDVELRADATAVRLGGGVPLLRGAEAVAEAMKGRARAASVALVNGSPALVATQNGRLRIAVGLTIEDGRIVAVEAIADPARLRALDVEQLDT